ncbi:MAG: hypothetical protein AAB229_04470 [Candidatus Hydrogenedentota bacterium]
MTTASLSATLEDLRSHGVEERKRIEEVNRHWTMPMIWELVALVLNVAGIMIWVYAPPAELRMQHARTAYEIAVRALRDHDYVTARHYYRYIGTQLPEDYHAEEATYTAGWIALNRIGDVEGARALFAQYIARHPDGKYADQVRENLDFLSMIKPGGEELARLIVAAKILRDRGQFAEAIALTDRLILTTRGTDLEPHLLALKKGMEDDQIEDVQFKTSDSPLRNRR